MITGRKAIDLQQLSRYNSALAQKDSIFFPLYDYQTYALAGTQLVYTFFSVPQGQGTTSAFGGSGPKTLLDTNLVTASQLPQGNEFVVQGIEVEFWPGVMPGLQTGGAFPAASVGSFVKDAYTVLRNGVLQFKVQDRYYVQDGPLLKFPTQTRLAGFAAVTETANAAATSAQVNYAAGCGAAYNMVPLRLYSNQAFNVTITFPATTALPSGVDGRLGVRLVGDMIRNAQ